MAIQKDLSELPKSHEREGLTPDPEPRFGHLLAQKWVNEDNGKPTATGTRYRFSDAAKCARYLSFTAAGFEPEPFDAPGMHVMKIGTWLHEQWQEVVQERYPGATVEGVGDLDITSGHYDLLVQVGGCERCWWRRNNGEEDGLSCFDDCDGNPRLVLAELKTTGGFSFKMMVGERGAAQGPRTGYIVQSALNARAHDADEVVIVVMATEAISKGAAERKGFDEFGRFIAEWTFERDEIDHYADEEISRLEAIDALVSDGKLAPRHVPYEMPPGARIVDLDKSMWTLTDDEGNVLDTGQVMGGNLCAFYCAQAKNCEKFSDPDTPRYE